MNAVHRTLPSYGNRLAGGLLGLLIGDAVGVPFEFMAPDQIPPLDQIDMFMPKTFHKTYGNVPYATWSDDGAQALCLLDSMLTCKGYHAGDFGQTLVAWYRHGYMAVNQHVFDVGSQTSDSIHKIIYGQPVLNDRLHPSRGNGAVMRVLPVALFHGTLGSAESIARDGAQSAAATHPGTIAQTCAALVALWGSQLLHFPDKIDTAYDWAWQELCTLGYDRKSLLLLAPDRSVTPKGTGEVVDCVVSARWALETSGDYRETVRKAISLGHDTDTTAAVAGGLAGIAYGQEGIPIRWRSQLRERDLVIEAVNALLDHHNIDEMPT